MIKCPKLKNLNADQIAHFLMRKYDEKSKGGVLDLQKKGFNAESLTNDKNNLFRFLILIAYDRQPFVPYEIVWEKDDPKSAFSVLDRNDVFDLEKIERISEDDLGSILKRCIIRKNLHLHNTNPKNERRGTKFVRTIKDIAQRIDEIRNLLRNVKSGLDAVRLHQKLCEIHGIKSTISAKFIMYTVRGMKIGNIKLSELDLIAKDLLGEWHNRKWVKRLEDPFLGGRKGLLKEIMSKLKEDPIAIDYLFTLDRDYCSKRKCDECEL